MEQTDTNHIKEAICVYLRDLWAICARGCVTFVSSCLRVCDVLCVSLCVLCASVVCFFSNGTLAEWTPR